ncbi:MAG: trimethylamine methyltransferase family protein [Candidatus Hodarchaeota archaeon]
MLKLSILSHQEQDLIHSAALDVLRNTGCEIQDKRWLDLLVKADLKVDHQNGRVYVTDEDIISSALQSCGRSVKFMARDPKNDWIFGHGQVKAHTPEGITHVIDLDTNRRRDARLSDLADITKICDCLPYVDGIVSPVIPSDIPPHLQSIMVTKTLIENSSKYIDPAGIAVQTGFDFVKQMLLALLGDRDVAEYCLGFGVIPTSPLTIPFEQLDIFWKGIELGACCDVGSMPQAGSTAPASLAGTLTLFIAEILIGLVMGQIKRPGLSQYVMARPSIANPRFGIFNSGPPEVGLLHAAATQLCKEKYNLIVNAGWGVSDSHVITPQVSYEKCDIWSLVMSAGADMVSGAGGLSSGLTSSPAQLVIDNEILGHLKYRHRGILIDDFHLGVEMIQKIGIGGTFLFHPDTSQIIRNEWYLTKLPIRESYGTWESAGSPDFVENAKKKAKEILDTHEVEPVEPDLKERLDCIFSKARKSLSNMK